MYIYKSLFSINKLNQNLVSFACSHCVGGLGICGGSRRYGFVQEPSNRLLVCVRSGEYVLEGSFGHLYTFIIKFGYNARCQWLKERALREYRA